MMDRVRACFLLGLALGLAAFAWAWRPGVVRARNEREIAAVLKSLASAEADFRGNDRDGNRVQDFWTGDVASLYYLNDLKLIPKAVADADARPWRSGARPPRPIWGYVLVAMEDDDGGLTAPERYAQDTQGIGSLGYVYNHSKFGFCAYPSDYPRSGRFTFILNEGNTVFKLDLGGKPLMRWPADGERCPKCRIAHTGSWCPCWQ